jgi:hypothetical protein
VDDDLVEALSGDEHLGRELGHGAVAGGLRGDAHPVAGRVADRLDDVPFGGRGDDDGGSHRDRDVPRRHERVVRRVSRDGDGAGRPGVELREAVETVGCDAVFGDGHGSSRSWWCGRTTVDPGS